MAMSWRWSSPYVAGPLVAAALWLGAPAVAFLLDPLRDVPSQHSAIAKQHRPAGGRLRLLWEALLASGLPALLHDSFCAAKFRLLCLLKPEASVAYQLASAKAIRKRYGAKRDQVMEIFLRKASADKSVVRPVVLFVPGAGSSDLAAYRTWGVRMSKVLNCTVVNVGYAAYPFRSIWGQVEAVGKATAWVRSAEGKEELGLYDVDFGGVVLCGHGNGAHLCMLSTLWSAMDVVLSTDAASKAAPPFLHPLIADGKNEGEISPADLLVDAAVGISGAYDLSKQSRFEQHRGIGYRSALVRSAGWAPELLEELSPEMLLQDLNAETVSMVPPISLLHGEWDGTVPVSSTHCFWLAIDRAREDANDAREKDNFVVFEEMAHGDVLDEITYQREDKALSQLVFTQLRSFVDDLTAWKKTKVQASASDAWRTSDKNVGGGFLENELGQEGGEEYDDDDDDAFDYSRHDELKA